MRRKIYIVGVAAIAALFALGIPSSASAFLSPSQLDPLTSPAAITGPVQAGVSGLVQGGDGASISSYASNPYSFISPTTPSYVTPPSQTIPTSPLPASVEVELTEMETGSRILPALDLVPALSTIALGVGAFSAGWAIGSVVNEKWLHLAGVGLGTTASVPSGSTNIKWTYQTPTPTGTQIASPPFINHDGSVGARLPAGLYLRFDNAGCGITNSIAQIHTGADVGFAGTVPTCSEIASAGIIANLGVSVTQVDEGWPIGPNPAGKFASANVVMIPKAQIPTRLVQDQPLQNWVGQPSTITTAWPTPGGQGDVTQSTTTLPASGDPWTCGTQGGSQVCFNPTATSTSFPAPSITGGTVTIPGITTGAGSYADPGLNLNRCISAPTLWSCPTFSGGGAVLTTGGPKFLMPDTTGLGVTDAETAVNNFYDGEGWTRPAFTVVTLSTAGAVLTKPAGAVITTSPAGGATVTTAPATILLNINPDPLPVLVLSPLPWETGSDYATRMAGLGVRVSLIPTGTPVSTYGPGEVLLPTDVPIGSSTWTATPGTRIVPNSTLTVPVNINTAPTPVGDPNPPPGGTSSCNCPAIDFSPLSGMGLGSKFPFGIFTYAAGIVGDFNVTAHAPDFNLNAQATGLDGHNLNVPYDVNLGDTSANHVGTNLNTYMGWWRDLLSFAMWVGALYWIGSKLLGFNAAGDPGASVDEVL